MSKSAGLSERNEIVIYQPDDVTRIEVRLEDETVWLAQSQMAELFGCTTRNVRMHLANIYACGELDDVSTRKDFFLVRTEGRRQVSRTFGASLKDLGLKCFAFTELGRASIAGIKARI